MMMYQPTSGQVNNIKVDQFGYRTWAKKIAVITKASDGFNAPGHYEPSSELQLINAETNEIALIVNPQSWNGGQVHEQSGDKVWWLDFSTLEKEGFYYIRDEAKSNYSPIFRIGDDIYNEVLMQAVRMYYYQRCGVNKEAIYAGAEWQDEACHVYEGQDLACRHVGHKNDPSTELDLSGGWHDAGDFNKYTTFTYTTLHNLLFAYENNPQVFFDNYNIPESGNGIPDLLDEIKFELDWLIKMQLADGSVLSKVSVTEHQGASPVSQDKAKRYYAPATISATRAFASVMAHGYRVFNRFDSRTDYAGILLSNAEKAWQYIQNNPGYSNYQNAGFNSANPERSEYDQKVQELTAAYFLYDATRNVDYLNYFEANLTLFHAVDWSYWYAFEYEYQRVLIDYCMHPDADPAKVQLILDSFDNSMNGGEFLPAILNTTDAYRAYLKDNDYVWGSNKAKSLLGCLFQDYAKVNSNDGVKEMARIAAEDYLHFLHGVNAHGIVLLTNMDEFGAENYCREMYHIWFAHGTEYDNADNSPKGPPPGFMTGGINKNYRPDNSYSGPPLEPPLNQPVQKAYRDWNTSWPENSWEITEPAIYYQAAYIHLLSYFASERINFASNYTHLEIDKVITSVYRPVSKTTRISPNPVEGNKIWITMEEEFKRVEIFDLNGRQFGSFIPGLEMDIINIEGIPTGIYIFRFINNQKVETEKVIINKPEKK